MSGSYDYCISCTLVFWRMKRGQAKSLGAIAPSIPRCCERQFSDATALPVNFITFVILCVQSRCLVAYAHYGSITR